MKAKPIYNRDETRHSFDSLVMDLREAANMDLVLLSLLSTIKLHPKPLAYRFLMLGD
jgi:hypothetical protein